MEDIEFSKLEDGEIIVDNAGSAWIIVDSMAAHNIISDEPHKVVSRTLVISNPSEWRKYCKKCRRYI